MSTSPRRVGFLMRYLSRLRFPWLFGVMLALLGADLVVPDLIPFADELLLAVVTLLLGSWKQRKQDRKQAPSEPGM